MQTTSPPAIRRSSKPSTFRFGGLIALLVAAITGFMVALAAAAAPAGAELPPGQDFDMTVFGSDGGVTAQPGSTIVYTLGYQNLGSDLARQVILSVQIPEHALADLTASTPGWACSPSLGAFANCTVDVGDVAGGAAGSANFVVTVNDPLPTGVDEIVLFVGCGEPPIPGGQVDGCGAATNAAGVFVGGSGFPETDASNNWDLVTTAVGTRCVAGTSSATGVEPCQAALPGTFVDGSGALVALPCPVGTFQPGEGQTSCLLAPTGFYVDAAGSIAATPCPSGTSTLGVGFMSEADCLLDFDRDGLPDVIDADDDGDGVLDGDDVCSYTDLVADTAPDGLKPNRFWSDDSGSFGISGVAVADTGGCSASQIIERAELGNGHLKFGISGSALARWAAGLAS